MQAVRIIDGRKDFVVHDIEAPTRHADGIIVRMEAAMVASYMGALPLGTWRTPPRPFTPGQCAIGVVEQGNSQISAGQKVYFDAFTGSRSADEPIVNHGFLGCFALGEAALPMMSAWPNGSFAELIHAPADHFTPLPDLAIPPELLCRLGWLGTAFHGLQQGGFSAGMRIAVNGATGIVGASAVVLALTLGAAEVHISGRRHERLSELVALEPSRVFITQAESDLLYDMVLDCAAGSDSEPSAKLISKLRRFGKAVIVGGLSTPTILDSAALMRNSNAVIGSYWFTKTDLAQLLGMAQSGVLDFTAFRAKSYKIENIQAAISFASSKAGGLEHTILRP